MSEPDLIEARIENLKKAQAVRKDEALGRVYKAIESLQKTGGKINFPTIAKEANVSVSYLYKYPELKQYIGELRNQQSALPRKPLAKTASSNSQAKIIGRFKERIRQLEEQSSELRRKNEALAGQVYRVHLLQAQVERQQQTIDDLQTRLHQAHAQIPSALKPEAKVTPITQAKRLQVSELIQEELKASGVKTTASLNRIISQQEENMVLLSIRAYNQYKETNFVEKPGACLRRAIEEGWVPNQPQEPSKPEQAEFERFYAEAVATGFLMDIPQNHLPIQDGEVIVKANQPSAHTPWTPMPWRQARTEYEKQSSVIDSNKSAPA